jgi:hypothetical protein
MTHLTAGTAGRAAHLSLLAAAAALILAAPSALALEEKSNEKTLIKSCEARLCTMLLQKNPKGDDLNCALTKTWAKSTIKKADKPTLQWGYGDAHCSVQIHIPRETIVKAMTAPEFSFQVASHTAECLVEENGEPQVVKATLSPKIVFKDGKAEKVWVNLEKIKGPVGIKASLWLAANLSDKVGLFHRPMIKAINKFIGKHCPKNYPNAVRATAAPQAQEREVASKRNGTPRPQPVKKHGG